MFTQKFRENPAMQDNEATLVNPDFQVLCLGYKLFGIS